MTCKSLEIEKMCELKVILVSVLMVTRTSAYQPHDQTRVLGSTGHVSMTATMDHVFVFFITPQYFNWSQELDGTLVARKNEVKWLMLVGKL